MDVARFETLAAASDALRQEIDLLEEVVSPYKRMLSEVARKGRVSKIGRAPHVVMLVDNPDAYKIIAAPRLRQAAAEEVIEWVQKEIWTIVGRNYGSFHGVPNQSFKEQPASLVQRQALIWADLGLSAADTFLLHSHALIYFCSLTCCMVCATEVPGGQHKANEDMRINPEKINTLWIACVYLAVLALTHREALGGPFEHNLWEAFYAEARNFKYLSPEKHGTINALIELVLRNLGNETCVGVEYWIEKFKDGLVPPAIDTKPFEQVPGSEASSLSSLSTSSRIA